MSHKVHPKAFRIKEIADWDSRGFYEKNFSEYLKEDFKIREFLKKRLENFGIERVEIERFQGKINIIITSSRPGLIIGRGGGGVEELKKQLVKVLLSGKQIAFFQKQIQPIQSSGNRFPAGTKIPEVRIEIREIKNSWLSASLSAQWIAQQIEKRIHFRRVLKQALGKITAHKAVLGARIEIAGRLNGARIARREWLKKGRLPRQTLRAQIDYARAEALCSYGVIGVKVWIYKGDKFE